VIPDQLTQNNYPFGWILRVIQEEKSPIDKFSEALRIAIEHLEKMPLDERVNWEKLIIYREPKEIRELINIVETNVIGKSRREAVEKMGKTMAQVLIEEGKEIGEEIGKEIGTIETKKNDIIKLLKFRFGMPSQNLIEKINSIHRLNQLDAIFDCILNIDTVEEFKKDRLATMWGKVK